MLSLHPTVSCFVEPKYGCIINLKNYKYLGKYLQRTSFTLPVRFTYGCIVAIETVEMRFQSVQTVETNYISQFLTFSIGKEQAG